MPKCQLCKEDGEKESMVCEEKPTGVFNKNGSEKMNRKYFHHNCYSIEIQDREFKENEKQELDILYQFLLQLHHLETLDGRMFEKIQDLRNGTIKINNRKINKYKQGVTYTLMLNTYKHISNRIEYVLQNNQFETKWNEFSYIFGMMTNNLNDVKQIIESHKKVEVPKTNINSDSLEINVVKNTMKKKDELDITEFL